MSKEKILNKKVVNNVQQLIEKAIKKHNMIVENDNILIGVSGGIDSLVLLENLAYKKLYYKFNFNLKAVHIDINNIPYSVNKNFLIEFCDKLNVEIIFIDKNIEIDNSKITTNPCFICSWNRRKLLFNYAKEHNFNKLALGHHRDDALETFMMNMIYHGSISSLPASLKMFDGRMFLIRPMIYLNKEQILKYAEIKNHTIKIKTCEYEHFSTRKKVEEVYQTMEKFNSNAKSNVFKALSNIFDEYLPE
jgi:tRNA(Ile)-lysidine synthetase-like protein